MVSTLPVSLDLLHLADTKTGNRGRGTNVQGNYDNAYFPFSNQVPSFSTQTTYQMQQWGQQWGQQQDVYNRYDPNHPLNRSPMNMGGWYPPTTYSASPAFNNASSAASFRGGYPAASGQMLHATSNSGTSNAYSSSYSQGGFPAPAFGNSTPSAGYDAGLIAAMGTLNFGGTPSNGGHSSTNKGAESKQA